MKLIGTAMIITACSCVGMLLSKEYISVLKGIERAEKLIKNISACLENENMSIPEIFEYISVLGDDKTNEFIENIRIGNMDNTSETAEQCGFCTDDEAKNILSEAFSVLGKSSASEQIKELDFCRNRLKSIRESKAEEIISKAKFARRIGFTAGVFAAVVLI